MRSFAIPIQYLGAPKVACFQRPRGAELHKGGGLTDAGAASITVQALQISDVMAVTVVGQRVRPCGAPLVVPLIRSGNQFSALAGNLPVGSDYTFTASASNGSIPPAEVVPRCRHQSGDPEERHRGHHYQHEPGGSGGRLLGSGAAA